MVIAYDNHSCTRNIHNEIYYYFRNRSLVIPLTNLADLQTGKRNEGDRIWLVVKQKGMN